MKKNNFLLILIILIHFLLLLFLRFTAWPEMILWPYLLGKGLLPYRDIIVVYPPTLVVLLTFLGKIFGVTLLNLKIYTWISILLTDLLVYWVAKKLTKNKTIAVFSLLFFVFWQPFFEGNGFWFDLVLAPLGLLTFYFLNEKRTFWSGLLFGIALSIKQTAFWFFLPILITFWLIREFRFRPFLRFCLGLIIPLIFCLFYLLGTGLIKEFYQWAINFGIFYLPKAPGQVLLPTIKQVLALGAPYGFCLLAVVLMIKKQISEKDVNLMFLFLVWSLFGVLGVFSRWEYFHFQPSLPFLSILSGMVIFQLIPLMKKRLNLLILMFLISVLIGSFYLQQRFYRLNWEKPTRFFEDEILQVAVWLKENTEPLEKIYILNSWDHLYALSNTLPAVSPLIHTLPWHLEYPGMQEKYVADLKMIKPRIIVFEPYREKGLGSYKPEKIDNYLNENYTLEEIIAGRFYILKLK